MASFTTRLGLRKPTAADPVNVATDLSENLEKLDDAAEFHVSAYANVNAAINAASAAGGGTVRLAVGANPVSNVVMKSRVAVLGPEGQVPTVWGYNSDPTDYQASWLEADGTSGSVVRWAADVVSATLGNVLIKANGRRAIDLVDSVTRGGNRILNTTVIAGDVYIGQKETYADDLTVLLSPTDGITVAAQDCDFGSVVVGFSQGDGFVLGSGSGPVRIDTLDSFINEGHGLVVNGFAHRMKSVQVNENKQKGVHWGETTQSIIQHLVSGDNGAEYTGVAPFTTRYPEVDFAGTASNIGCGILGGTIYTTTGDASRAVENNEGTPTFPMLSGIYFSGTFGEGTSPYDVVSSLTSFTVRGCINVPDILAPQGGIPVTFRPNGSGVDQLVWTDGSGNPYSGVTSAGALYLPLATQGLSVNGAVTINARAANTHIVTLTANATSSSITNPSLGQTLTIEWVQAGAGGFTYAWPVNCRFRDGVAPLAVGRPSAEVRVSFVYDGTNWREVSRSAVAAKNDSQNLGIVMIGDPRLGAAVAAFSGANRAIFGRVISGGAISKIGVDVGTSSGNISVAAYRNDGSTGRSAAPGTRLATSGAVACPATGYQEVSLGATVAVEAGDWLCLSCDNTTATFTRWALPTTAGLYSGLAYRQDTAHPAPSPIGSLTVTGVVYCLIGVA